MPDSKQKLPDEVREYCQKAIVSRAKAFILRGRVACRVCYNRGGLEPTCVQCGKLIAERSTIHKIDGRVYCFQCDRALRQERHLERFVAEGGKIASVAHVGGGSTTPNHHSTSTASGSVLHAPRAGL